MYKPNSIQLHIIGKCQLKCGPCAKISPCGYMDIGTFKRVVDECMSFGIRRFELTPVYGDLFLDDEFIDKVVYMNSLDIDHAFFFTNLLGITPETLSVLEGLDKIKMRVSVYGDSCNQYRENTGVDCFDTFVDRMNLLSETNGDTVQEINIRYTGWSPKNLKKISNPLYSILSKMIYRKVITLDNIIDESVNENWNFIVNQGYNLNVTSHTKKGGVCCAAINSNCIFPNGDITLCGCMDVKGRMIIGNIFNQGLDSVYGDDGLYSKLIRCQRDNIYSGMCIDCTMFDSHKE